MSCWTSFFNLLRPVYNTRQKLSMQQDEEEQSIIYFHRKVKTTLEALWGKEIRTEVRRKRRLQQERYFCYTTRQHFPQKRVKR